MNLTDTLLKKSYYAIIYGKHRTKKTSLLLWLARQNMISGKRVLFLVYNKLEDCEFDVNYINKTLRKYFPQQTIDALFTIKSLDSDLNNVDINTLYDVVYIDDVDLEELNAHIKTHNKLIDVIGVTPIILSVSTKDNTFNTATEFIAHFLNPSTQKIWTKTQRVFKVSYKHIKNKFIYSIYKLLGIKNFKLTVVYTKNGDFNRDYKFLNYKENFEC